MRDREWVKRGGRGGKKAERVEKGGGKPLLGKTEIGKYSRQPAKGQGSHRSTGGTKKGTQKIRGPLGTTGLVEKWDCHELGRKKALPTWKEKGEEWSLGSFFAHQGKDKRGGRRENEAEKETGESHFTFPTRRSWKEEGTKKNLGRELGKKLLQKGSKQRVGRLGGFNQRRVGVGILTGPDFVGGGSYRCARKEVGKTAHRKTVGKISRWPSGKRRKDKHATETMQLEKGGHGEGGN